VQDALLAAAERSDPTAKERLAAVTLLRHEFVQQQRRGEVPHVLAAHLVRSTPVNPAS
jgi:hypothetical protein